MLELKLKLFEKDKIIVYNYAIDGGSIKGAVEYSYKTNKIFIKTIAENDKDMIYARVAMDLLKEFVKGNNLPIRFVKNFKDKGNINDYKPSTKPPLKGHDEKPGRFRGGDI